jgi:hypothetical protein
MSEMRTTNIMTATYNYQYSQLSNYYFEGKLDAWRAPSTFSNIESNLIFPCQCILGLSLTSLRCWESLKSSSACTQHRGVPIFAWTCRRASFDSFLRDLAQWPCNFFWVLLALALAGHSLGLRCLSSLALPSSGGVESGARDWNFVEFEIFEHDFSEFRKAP